MAAGETAVARVDGRRVRMQAGVGWKELKGAYLEGRIGVDAIVSIASDKDGQIPSDAFETNASTGSGVPRNTRLFPRALFIKTGSGDIAMHDLPVLNE